MTSRAAPMTVVGLRLGLLALFLAIWEVAGRMVNPLLGVPPSAVLPSLRDLLLLRSYPDLPASLLLTIREIGEGTSEIQRLVIAREILQLT